MIPEQFQIDWTSVIKVEVLVILCQFLKSRLLPRFTWLRDCGLSGFSRQKAQEAVVNITALYRSRVAFYDITW